VSAKRRRKRRPRKPPPPKAPDAEDNHAAAAKQTSTPSRRRRSVSLDERPPAPWGNVPLVELVVLVGIVLLVAGFIAGGSQGTLMIATGVVLCSIAGLELAIREHFGGYRSHTFLLSGAVGIAVLAGLYFLTPDLWFPIALAIAAAGFAATAWMLTRAFQRRSGRTFKLR
jgi:hypothetical protein